MQHACATDADGDSRMAPAYSGPLVGPASTPKLDRLQPTLSYCGSDLWHWLTFQELRHLEHHDFPRAATERKLAPWVPGVAMSFEETPPAVQRCVAAPRLVL